MDITTKENGHIRGIRNVAMVEKVIWNDRIGNEEVLTIVKGSRSLIETIRQKTGHCGQSMCSREMD